MFSITIDADYDNKDYGRAFEVLIGSYLNTLSGRLYYWRERNYEVDFIYEFGKKLYAIEVKYGKDRSMRGLEKFIDNFPKAIPLLVTTENYQELLKGRLIK